MTNKQKANEVTGMAEDRGLRDKSVEEPKPLSPTAYTLGRAHTCPKCEHSNIPCPENRRAAPVASPDADATPVLKQLLPPLGDRAHHLETDDLVAAMGVYDYTVRKIEQKLHLMTSGERYTLYRAVMTLVDERRASKAPDGWTPITIPSRQDDARAWIVCATEHPDPSRREEAVNLIAEGLAAICDRSITDDRRGIASLDEHGWTPIKVPSRQDIKAARLVDGKVQFLVRIEGMKDYVLDDLHPDNHLRMYLEASYWQQRCFALEKERDEFERKGKDLCSAYGESLIKVADLEAELKALKGAAE